MKIYHSSLPLLPDLNEFFPEISPNPCFFDIETTGLSWRNSHLCLLGIVSLESDSWQITQIFLESPLEEKQALETFLSQLSAGSLLIHYNGSTFDIPYLTGKCGMYGIDFSFHARKEMDLYRRLRPFQHFLPSSSMKQKDLELLTGFTRSDRMDSSQIARFYKKYILTRDEKARDLLLLHNCDDLKGMMALWPLLSLERLFSRSYPVHLAEDRENSVTFSLSEGLDLSFPIAFSSGPFSISNTKNQLQLSSAAVRETMKLFFPNYRDYYYLPEEDMAIHKSVGQFVDKNHRRQATAATCYQRKEDIFLPAPPGFSVLPLFTRSYREKEKFCLKKDVLQDPSAARQYVYCVLQHLLHG
ncbi:MAG: ribonuclease H-like domain-containing protein [Ruminococcus sp.]